MSRQMTTMNTKIAMNKVEQVGGTHYQNNIQPWDEFRRLNVSWAQGEITKYLCRWPNKGGIQDLKKALSIAQKYQSPNLRKEHRFISYYPEFIEQYREIYGEQFENFHQAIRAILKEDWFSAETLIQKLIDHYEEV